MSGMVSPLKYLGDPVSGFWDRSDRREGGGSFEVDWVFHCPNFIAHAHHRSLRSATLDIGVIVSCIVSLPLSKNSEARNLFGERHIAFQASDAIAGRDSARFPRGPSEARPIARPGSPNSKIAT
jgi:hypothetical protein